MEYGGREHGVADREDSHSRMGIASLVLAILVGVLVFLIIAGAGVLKASTPGGMDEDTTLVVLIGFAVIGCLLANLVGLGLGIAGLIQLRRKKLFTLLGAIFNGLVVLVVLAVIVLGLALGG